MLKKVLIFVSGVVSGVIGLAIICSVIVCIIDNAEEKLLEDFD